VTLNIMVLDGDPAAADGAARELTEAGHVVLRCHEAGAPAFPCRGIVDQSTCPLSSHAVDVALAVASPARPTTEAADGGRCVLMHHVPLVVAGASELDPYRAFATRVVDGTGDVVASCEAAAAAELPDHAARAEAVIATSIGLAGGTSPTVTVVRRGGGLHVKVAGLEQRTTAERQAAVVRIVGALRELDHAARSIDVELVEPST
jgi:hypothetical protein